MKAETKQIGKKRWYPCPKCGDQHPSITTILDVISSPNLMGWMGKNGTAKLNVYAGVIDDAFGFMAEGELIKGLKARAEERWKLKEDTAFWKSGKETGADAADYGTMAHAWLESHLNGVSVDLNALPEPSRNAVNAYLLWEKQHELKTLKTEQTFYCCKLNYAGTADWVGMIDGELTLMDWKSSSGIFFNYPIQVLGYAIADEMQNADRLYRQVGIGRFGKDGISEVRFFKRNGSPSIDTARDVLIACSHIFAAQQTWEQENPYKRKTKGVISAT